MRPLTRWIARLLLLGLLLGLPVSAKAQAGAARWPERFGGPDPPAKLAGLERQALIALRRALARQGVLPCRSTERLTAAARAHARHLLVAGTPPGRLEAEQVRREVRRAGGAEPTVMPWAVSFTGEINLDDRLARLARRFASRPPTHCGVGLAQAEGRQILVVVGVRRRVTLDPFPARAASGDRFRLDGVLASGYRAPEVLVTTPLGHVRHRRILRRSGRFGAWIDFPGPGRYTVEVMASGPQGPEIVALFPVFVDIEPSAGGRPARIGSRPAPAPAQARLSAAATLLELLNAEREGAGLLPIQRDPQLDRLAAEHSRDMLDRGYFGHVSPSGRDLTARLSAAGIFTYRAAENLVRSSSPQRAHARLMESPAHRANILDPELTHVGVGVVRRQGELVVTQIFVAW